MKLPRDLSGDDVVKGLGKLGYTVVRQKGSHIRLTTDRNGQHHVTVPDHESIKVGTLAGIFKDVSEHLGIDRDELLREMFG
jgi:predicted RNA binding protein YcfA (HicA-like mRNA interferase family)